jgi:Holliday junction resolvase RusA-like endonuclease
MTCSVPTSLDVEPLFHIVIPVEKHLTKKNGKRAFHDKKSGKTWVTSKPGVREQEVEMTYILMSAKNQIRKDWPLTQDIHAEFIFTFDDFYTKKFERRKNLPDLSNLIELPQDALQKAGIIENDTQICFLDGSTRKPGDKNILEIYLWSVND